MIRLLFSKPVTLFIFSSPQDWFIVIIAGFLLFGANRLPELAKSLGQTRKAFKEGLQEAVEEQANHYEGQKKLNPTGIKPIISEIDDAELDEELRRRRLLN